MCELLGSEPVESEIPIDREDLNIDTQLALHVYDKLPANWEGFSGQYMGKDLSLIPILVKQYKYDETLINYVWEIIPIIDNIVSKDIAQKQKSRSKSTKG
jgi:hypothetical protein